MTWEINFLKWIWENLHGSPFIENVMKILTIIGDGIYAFAWMAPLAIILIIFKKTRKTGIVLAITLLFFGLLGNNLIIKSSVRRVRPLYVDNELLSYAQAYFTGGNAHWIPKSTSWSFMSGHTVHTFIVAIVISIYHKKFIIPAIILASLISFTRLFFGFHYPTDIIAGALYALLCSVGVAFAANKVEKKIIEKRATA